MVLEGLLTKIEVDRFSSEIIAQFKGLGAIHHPWNHLFVTEMLGRKTFDEKERLANAMNYKRVKTQLENNSKLKEHFNDGKISFKKLNPRTKTQYWTILQWYGPITLEKQLPKEFIKGKYDKQAVWRLAKPFSYIKLEEITNRALYETKKIKHQLSEFEQKIRQNRSASSGTRLLNDIDEIFDKYDATNFKDIINIISQNKILNSLEPGIIAQRKEIANKILTLNKQINPEIKLHYAPFKSKKRNHSLKLIKNSFEYLKSGRMITGQEFFAHTNLFFDVETPFFEDDDYTIYFNGANFLTAQKSDIKVYTIADHHSFEYNFKGYSVEVKCFPNENKLMENFEKDISSKSNDLLAILAHNLQFDMLQVRETESGFSVGANSTGPKLEATTPFFKRFKLDDYLLIDTLNWARIALNYKINLKIESITGFKKSITYKKMANSQRDILSKSNTSKKSFYEILNYQIEDITQPTENLLETELFQNTITDAFVLSRMYGVAINRLLYSANAINDAQEKAYFEKLGIYRDAVPPHFKTDWMEKHRQEAKTHFKTHVIEKLLDNKDKKGLSTNISKVFLPLGDLFNDSVKRRFPDLSKLIKYKSAMKNDKARLFFLEQYNNAFARWIVEDYGFYLIDVNQYDKIIKNNSIDETEFQTNYLKFRHHLRKNSKEDFEKLNKNTLSIKATEKLSEPILEYLEIENINTKTFTQLANLRSKIKRRGRNIIGNYSVFPSRRFFRPEKYRKKGEVLVLDEYIKSKLDKINSFVEENDLEIVAQEGYFLYLRGDSKPLDEFDCPVIKVDEISELYNADNPYYEQHGFMSHMNLKQESHFNLCKFETEYYGPIIQKFLLNENYDAQDLFQNALHLLEQKDIPAEDLIYFNKSKNRNMIFTEESEREDSKLFWITDKKYVPFEKDKEGKLVRKEIKFDEKRNLSYFEDEINSKVSKVYITKNDNFKRDFSLYEDRFLKKAKKIMKPVFHIGKNSSQYVF